MFTLSPPLIAAEAVMLFVKAGLDRYLIALAPGPGSRVGAGLRRYASPMRAGRFRHHHQHPASLIKYDSIKAFIHCRYSSSIVHRGAENHPCAQHAPPNGA